MVVELVVAEPVEASKRPVEKANQDGGFDRLSNREFSLDVIQKTHYCKNTNIL